MKKIGNYINALERRGTEGIRTKLKQERIMEVGKENKGIKQRRTSPLSNLCN